MMAMRSLASLASLVLVASLCTVARADAIDPAEEACGEVGKACSVGGRDGACVKDTCTRLDYGNMADGTPSTREYECVRCIPGATPEGSAKTEPEPEGSRCSVVPSTSTTSLLLGVALLGLVVARRRA